LKGLGASSLTNFGNLAIGDISLDSLGADISATSGSFGLSVSGNNVQLPYSLGDTGDFDGDLDVDGADFLKWQCDGFSLQKSGRLAKPVWNADRRADVC
jgi:hypothetical protein